MKRKKFPSNGSFIIKTEDDWAIAQSLLFSKKFTWSGDDEPIYFDWDEVIVDHHIPACLGWNTITNSLPLPIDDDAKITRYIAYNNSRADESLFAFERLENYLEKDATKHGALIGIEYGI